MINFNGNIIPSSENSFYNNRAFLYGDAVFETFKIIDNKILFFEDHYFRLMSSMRIIRMQIPMDFTMEYLEEQILNLIRATTEKSDSHRVRILVYRNQGGFYLPKVNSISFIVSSVPLENALYSIETAIYEVDLYKDFYVTKQLLSTIKSTNRMINIMGSVFADENGLDNCLLLNDDKNVIEALQGNFFMFMNNRLITPPISEGCLNGVMRKQILSIAKKIDAIEVVEIPISPFDLQKADELFITNVIKGIQPITKYRKKKYQTQLANDLIMRLNAMLRLT